MDSKHKKWALVLATTLGLWGCGGGTDVSTTPGAGTAAANVTGIFVDATVAGLSYKCAGSTAVSGTTNAAGQYTCPAGQPVGFYVGDILIGSVSSPQAVVTPLDLVGSGATPSNPTVANMVRFLMSISSSDPNTGKLTIDPAVVAAASGKAIDFATASAAALDALITTIKPGATVYTSAQASAHVSASITALFAGNYAGTYAGADSGNWTFTVDNKGVVKGALASGDAVVGSIATTLSVGSSYAFKGTAGEVPWLGTFNVSTKAFSGTWNDGAGSSGTWVGNVAATSSSATNTGTTSTSTTTANTTPTTTTTTTTTPESTSTSTTTAVVSPTVSGFSPSSGAVSATVTIAGDNLGRFTPAALVKFGNTTVTVVLNSSNTSIAVRVPAGLALGTHTLSMSNLDGSGALNVGVFTVVQAPSLGSGLTIEPAFNAIAAFAAIAPTGGAQSGGHYGFTYSQHAANEQVTIQYLNLSPNFTLTVEMMVGADEVVNGQTRTVFSSRARKCTHVGTPTATFPDCASVGVAFNTAAGTLTLTNAVFSANVGSPVTVNGSLAFPPF